MKKEDIDQNKRRAHYVPKEKPQGKYLKDPCAAVKPLPTPNVEVNPFKKRHHFTGSVGVVPRTHSGVLLRRHLQNNFYYQQHTIHKTDKFSLLE